MARAAGPERVLIAFVEALRTAGLRIGTGEALDFCRAVTHVDVASSADVFHAGRAVLVHRRADLDTYASVFRTFFHPDEDGDAPPVEGLSVRAVSSADEAGGAADAVEEPEHELAGAMGSKVEVLRTKRFDACSPGELARISHLLARMDLAPPPRPGRRTRPASAPGRVDLRRSVRASLRSQGELLQRSWRDRRPRLRPLVFLLDISGSMAAYSRALLQLAYVGAIQGDRSARVEVFCFGTRLTRVTPALRRRRPDAALAAAAARVVDWGGGTRIGDAVRDFLQGWGRAGAARGAVVVICSDGLDCGDPEVLGRQMALLSRLAHQVVWVNPLKADVRYEPLARGMAAALPHVDSFVTGHDLASLEALAGLVAATR